MPTILEIIDNGTSYLEKRSIEDARTNMQLMIAGQLKCSRTQVYMDFDREVPESDLTSLRAMLKRRGTGEPLQHILGSVEFCGHEFRCDSRALVPRPETEELVALCQEIGLPAQPKILDLCCGSGVIGLSLAKAYPSAEVTLTDISPACIELTSENARALNLANTQLRESDLFAQIAGKYDLIVSNPPYIAEGEKTHLTREVDHDPDNALYSGEDGLDCLDQLIPAAVSHLNAGATLALEIGYDQSAAVCERLEQAGYCNVRVQNDLNSIPRFIFATAPEVKIPKNDPEHTGLTAKNSNDSFN